jgi:hypothetical protein
MFLIGNVTSSLLVYPHSLSYFNKFVGGSKNGYRPQLKNKQTKGAKRIDVEAYVFGLLIKCPNKVWTSDELAEKIGCSSSAVRKTSAWKSCQKQNVEARQQSSIRKGLKDKHGDIIVAIEDNEIDD